MNRSWITRILASALIAAAVVAALAVNAFSTYASVPHPVDGTLDLAGWDGQSPFEVAGQWEFYWGRVLSPAQMESGAEPFEIVEAPCEWNYYDLGSGALPGFGRATYRIHVAGAQAGTQYGLRVQNMASAYRLYADGMLIAQNGAFGDRADAAASGYRPQLAAFTARTGSFDIVLQVSNDAYAVGGMWEPLVFGTAGQVAGFDRMLSGIVTASCAGLAVMCLFFIVFFAAQYQEKDMLILAGIGVLLLLRLAVCGDVIITYILPAMPIAGFGWIDYLTLLWIQFLLLYFVYCSYGQTVRRWQITALLIYSAAASLCVMLLPFEWITSAYGVMNLILLLVLGFVAAQLARAALRRQPGAAALFGALLLIFLLNIYGMFVSDWSLVFYSFSNSAADYTALFFVQCAIIAVRYNRAQRAGASYLKGQIRPHFVHNALAGIAGAIRTDPEGAREMIGNLNGYLRGFFDYEGDEKIPLREELELVRAYAGIEQTRCGARVQVEYRIESEELLVPPLVLQPLVENAFVHGLREKEEGGVIEVFAVRAQRGGTARIGVRDNGKGLESANCANGRRGVGIENINRRLARLYRTQLAFAVPEGGGCEVYMEIPWKEAKR